MFATYSSPLSNFQDLFTSLESLQRFQQYQNWLQRESRPKIIKKVEAEDRFQIQIFKENGNFDSYEVKVLRHPYHAKVVNLVLESQADNFLKVFQFKIDDIEVHEINWEYFEHENVLVLNVPKRAKFCSDDMAMAFLTSFFGSPVASLKHRSCPDSFLDVQPKRNKTKRSEGRYNKMAKQIHDEQQWDELIENTRRRASKMVAGTPLKKPTDDSPKDASKRKSEKAQREATKTTPHEARGGRKEKSQTFKAKKVKAPREVEFSGAAKFDESKVSSAANESDIAPVSESERQEMLRQKEFMRQLFGLSPEKIIVQINKDSVTTEKDKETTEKNTSASLEAVENAEEERSRENSDTESIHSEVSTPDTASSSTHPLTKLPLLEEVEDEEFILFRKKFEQS